MGLFSEERQKQIWQVTYPVYPATVYIYISVYLKFIGLGQFYSYGIHSLACLKHVDFFFFFFFFFFFISHLKFVVLANGVFGYLNSVVLIKHFRWDKLLCVLVSSVKPDLNSRKMLLKFNICV